MIVVSDNYTWMTRTSRSLYILQMSFALVIQIPPPACVCVEGHVGSRVCLSCALGIDVCVVYRLSSKLIVYYSWNTAMFFGGIKQRI